MNAVTSNSSDQQALSLKDLGDCVLKLKQQPSLRAIRISRATLLCFPAVPTNQAPLSRLYGVPVEIDDSLGLFEALPVYREATNE